jgi:hypothetical protein
VYNHKLYLGFWLINFSVIFLFGWVFPSDIVLGNWKFSALEGAIYSSFWLTFFVWTAWDFIFSRGIKYKAGLIAWIYFFLVNSLAIWLIARFSHILAMGISSWVAAVFMGVVVVIGQKFIWWMVTRRELRLS